MRRILAVLALSGWLAAAGMPRLIEVRPAAATAPVEVPPLSRSCGELQARHNAAVLARAEESARAERFAAERDSALAEVARYRAGLERAVAELNRQTARPAAPPPPPRRAARRAPERRSRPKRVAVEPSIQVLGDRVVVRGRVANRDPDFLAGRLTIELRVGGRRHSTASQLVEVAGGGSASWEHTFHVTGLAFPEISADAWFETG